jgi:hypothetical protein
MSMKKESGIIGKLLYSENVTSSRTEALFISLSIIFTVGLIWRIWSKGLDVLAIILLFFTSFFLFYSLNYRTLIIQLFPDALRLTFGLFSWRVPLQNVADFGLDDLPWVLEYGGAGIHFMFVRSRYRASFNFLEYPRIVIAFKNKVGLVNDISFSTRHPEQLIENIREAISDLSLGHENSPGANPG